MGQCFYNWICLVFIVLIHAGDAHSCRWFIPVLWIHSGGRDAEIYVARLPASKQSMLTTTKFGRKCTLLHTFVRPQKYTNCNLVRNSECHITFFVLKKTAGNP